MITRNFSLRFCLWLLSRFVDNQENYGFFGDFEEMYQILAKKNRLHANIWLWSHLIRTLPPILFNHLFWRFIMFRNYFKTALRNIKKHKGYSFINIIGLALGMAACILILLWIQDEISYDRFHKNSANIYRIIQEKHTNTTFCTPVTPPALALHLKEKYPEIENSARIVGSNWSFRYGDNFEKSYSQRGLFADPSFLEIFTFDLLKGNPNTALDDPMSVVISEDMAKIIFTSNEPIGQILLLNNEYSCKVTGVFKTVPTQSSIQFNFIVPIKIMEQNNYNLEEWRNSFCRTYFLLKNQHSWKEFNSKIAGLVKQHIPESTATLIVQPLRTIHFYVFDGASTIIYVYIFAAIAIFVLLTACINFMNLTTARSSNRSQEVGLRKVVGAYRTDLIKQFYSESIMMSGLALLVAIIFVYSFLPVFNQISGKELSFNLSSQKLLVLSLMLIALITGIISGSYPAIFLSSFQPVKVLKKTLKAGPKGSAFRKVLVVIQFTLSIFLLICTLIISKQLGFLQNKNLGFEKENLIFMRTSGLSHERFYALREELIQEPSIINMTRTNAPLLWLGLETTHIKWEGKKPNDQISIQLRTVDYNYLETFKMEMLKGRFFSREFATDATEGFILNEAAVKAMGIESPVGKKLFMEDQQGTIIGVVKNFHHHSMHTEIEPLTFFINPRWYGYVFVRCAAEQAQEAIKILEKHHEQIDPGYPFQYQFIEDRLDRLYSDEQRTGTVIKYFTVLAICIACLGLFGLASYVAEQRTKEIGVRKVLGASISGIVVLISRDFLKWVSIANILAWPVAYFVMHTWLENFAYRTNIGIWIFILSALISISIALITVSFQSIKAAISNPVNSLKYE